MKKILYITNNFPPAIDGVGDYTYRLVESLYHSSTVNEYHVITKAQISRQIQDELKNVKFYNVENWDIKSYQKIAEYIRKEKIDILHLQYVPYSFSKYGIPLLLPLFLLFTRLFRNCKLIITFHEVRIKREFRKNIVIAILQGIIAKAMYLFTHKTITSNNFYKNLIWKHGSTEIIPIGSNVTPISIDILNDSIFKSNSKFVISSFGNGIKSYKIILEAISLLKEEAENVELKFIGQIKEPELTHIKELARALQLEQILNIKGYLPNERVYEELVKSDIYLMLEDIYKPSSWKGISHKSGTFAASISAGLPIVAFSGELTDKQLLQLPFIYYSNHSKIQIVELLSSFFHLSLQEKNNIKTTAFTYYQNYLSWKVIADLNYNLYKID